MIDELLARIAAFYRGRTPCPEFAMVAEVLAVLDEVTSPVEILVGEPLAVVRHLDAIETAGTGADPTVGAILEAFVRIADRLPWRQTASYVDVLSPDYLANYGYVQLVGPAPTIVEHPDVRIGLGLWGPNLEYPLHEHAAEELYHVLAGEPMFGSEDGSWRPTQPGDAVHNPPWQRHRQRFGESPTVLLYCWTGAVGSDAVLVAPSG